MPGIMGQSTRIRSQLEKERANIHFTAGPYGGPNGMGVSVQIFNDGPGRAYDAILEIPGIDSAAQNIGDLDPGHERIEQIPFSPDSPVRKQPMENLKVQLVYQDRFERKFIASRDLESFQGADGVYRLNQKSDQRLQVDYPSEGFIDLWQLRKKA